MADSVQKCLSEIEYQVRELAVLLTPFSRYMDLERPFCGGERGDPIVLPAGFALAGGAGMHAHELWDACRKLEDQHPGATRLVSKVRGLAAVAAAVLGAPEAPGLSDENELAYDAYQEVANQLWDMYTEVAAVVFPAPAGARTPSLRVSGGSR